MTTDLEIWRDLFTKYNITFFETKSNEIKKDSIWSNSISLETDEGKGYNGFTFNLVFNMDGSFRCYGVWE